MHLKNNLKVLVVSVLLLFSFSANSQDFVCKSANLLGPKLITDICWRCIFPMKLAGATMNPFNATKEIWEKFLQVRPRAGPTAKTVIGWKGFRIGLGKAFQPSLAAEKRFPTELQINPFVCVRINWESQGLA